MGSKNLKRGTELFMKPARGFFRRDERPKRKLSHASKSTDEISGNDLRVLKKILGEFDPESPACKAHKKLIQNPRFENSELSDDNRIFVRSASGYCGHHSTQSLHRICHGS